MPVEPVAPKRLYQKVADQLSTLIAQGEFPVGTRLPAERKLAEELEVSRPTIREAMIALEIAGLVEIRTGAGIYVVANVARQESSPTEDIGPGPFELIEARTLFEGEAAAVAAVRISETELKELEDLCREMTVLIEEGKPTEWQDQRFHQAIAAATRNSAILSTIDQMWDFRTRMPMWQRLHTLISELEGQPGWTHDQHSILDHRRILSALRARDPDAARAAMRSHLDHVKEALLAASELEDVDLSNARTFVESGADR